MYEVRLNELGGLSGFGRLEAYRFNTPPTAISVKDLLNQIHSP